VSDLDFEQLPMGAVGVFALRLVGQGVSDADAVARLRSENVSRQALLERRRARPCDLTGAIDRGVREVGRPRGVVKGVDRLAWEVPEQD
jgi:hypothetical protein